MINTKTELKKTLDGEKRLYFDTFWDCVKLYLLRDHDYLLWRYVKSLRFTEYHYNAGHRLRYLIWQRRKNILGARLGITIWHNTVDCGLKIWHYGAITINGHAKIGKNCQLHGENCIGNKGVNSDKAPIIGDNVDIGVGAKIIGDVIIADDIKIGANAVVTKSFNKKGVTLVGIPAVEKK